MKVLQLCNKPSQPIVDGGCIAINNIATGLLNENVDLKILTISTEKHPFEIYKFDKEFARRTRIESIFVDTRVNVIDAFSALVTNDSYNINRFFSPDFNKRLIEILTEEQFDIIHLESLFMTPYIDTIRKNNAGKIVLRSHNLEHFIWERLANSTGNSAKKLYLKHLSSRLKKYEYKTIKEVDGIAAISFEDTLRYEKLEVNVPLITIPFGINLAKYPSAINKIEGVCTLFHIGSMDWEPNKEAVNWLLDDIWPKLSKQKLELHLAGRKMPSYIRKQANEKLIIHNEVHSAIEFMSNYDIMIAPLLSGSGMRVKIIEAMGIGKTVITTKIGAEGISYVNGENIRIANTSEEIIDTVKELIANPKEVERIGKNARKLIESNYDNPTIVKNLLKFYKSI